jgi:thiol:disulfide interchange protein
MQATFPMKPWLKLLLLAASGYWLFNTLIHSSRGQLPQSLAGPVQLGRTQHKKVVLLITGSAWCPSCQQMESGLLSTPQWLAFAAKEIVFQKYDYPDPSSPPTPAHQDLLKLPGVRGFPTLVVADGDGRILGIRAGYGAVDYLEWIRSL